MNKAIRRDAKVCVSQREFLHATVAAWAFPDNGGSPHLPYAARPNSISRLCLV
jgi:hypothetical protein